MRCGDYKCPTVSSIAIVLRWTLRWFLPDNQERLGYGWIFGFCYWSCVSLSTTFMAVKYTHERNQASALVRFAGPEISPKIRACMSHRLPHLSPKLNALHGKPKLHSWTAFSFVPFATWVKVNFNPDFTLALAFMSSRGICTESYDLEQYDLQQVCSKTFVFDEVKRK